MKQTMVFFGGKVSSNMCFFHFVLYKSDITTHTHHDFAWRQFKENNTSVLLLQVKSSETLTYIRHQTSILFIKFVNLSNVTLLMEEIRKHHLGCSKNHVDNGINYQPQLVNAGFLNHLTVDTPCLWQKSPSRLATCRNVSVNKSSLWWSSERRRVTGRTHPWRPFSPPKDYWLVVSNIFYFHPYLGILSNLTNIFQMGLNHQLD